MAASQPFWSVERSPTGARQSDGRSLFTFWPSNGTMDGVLEVGEKRTNHWPTGWMGWMGTLDDAAL
jgi:hypothetical protein